MSNLKQEIEEILSDDAAGICYEFCNPNEEHVKPYGNPKAVQYHFHEQIQAIQEIIDSAKQEAYKQGYIDGGISQLTGKGEV